MDKQIYEFDAGGKPLRFLLNESGTVRHFAVPLRFCGGEDYDICVTEELQASRQEKHPPEISDVFLEYKLLIIKMAHQLLRRQACTIHAVGILWKELAWLLCAPSGTGKTTQFIRWRQLAGKDVGLISGDQPIVTVESAGEVKVWSAPWSGKEYMIDGFRSACLGGIIFLEQDTINSIKLMSPEDSVPRLLQSFMAVPDTEEEIRNLIALADAMLKCPVWLLRNRGDFDSARLTMDTIRNYLSEKDETE